MHTAGWGWAWGLEGVWGESTPRDEGRFKDFVQRTYFFTLRLYPSVGEDVARFTRYINPCAR